jgi:hypothetical protein
MAHVKRCAIEAEDWLRYHPVVRGVLSRYQVLRDRMAGPRDQAGLVRSIVKLCAAARLAGSDAAVAAIQQRIRERVVLLDPKRVDWAPLVAHLEEPVIGRALLLKPWLGPREKGVLFVSFEKEWFKLLRHCDLNEFSERYDLVLAPSSSPHNFMNYVFAAAYPRPLFTLLSNAQDQVALPRVAPNFVVVPLYASNWVNPGLFAPRPRGERDIDIIMVASFGKVKRHHALFTAIRRLPPATRVLLVGQDQDDRTAATIETEARYYGVAGRFAVQSNVSYPGVAAALGRARVSVVLSRREGSCVVVTESLFADTPVALLENAEIGSRAFINPATGRFLKDHDLGGQLQDFLAHAEEFSPRAWADANIGCRQSTQTLNALLRRHALDRGDTWTEDIAPLCWRPDPALVEAEDVRRLQDERAEFRRRFGIDVGPRP